MLRMNPISGMPKCYERWIRLRWENLTPEQQAFENQVECAWEIARVNKRIAQKPNFQRPRSASSQTGGRSSAWWPKGDRPIDAVDSAFRTAGIRDIRRY